MSIHEPILMKSKERVQKHGEVFSPKWIVNLMLDIPGIKACCEDLKTTFLEPAAGEGAFLIEILNRKLAMVVKNYNQTLEQFENFSLFALSTLYGIELLEDNAQVCVMNVYQVYIDFYKKEAEFHKKQMKNKVLNSAQTIISKNIVQGNFLTRMAADGNAIVVNEWKPEILNEKQKIITVNRTEYTLDEIFNQAEKPTGTTVSRYKQGQLTLFDFMEEETVAYSKSTRYVPCKITDVYREEQENIDN